MRLPALLALACLIAPRIAAADVIPQITPAPSRPSGALPLVVGSRTPWGLNQAIGMEDDLQQTLPVAIGTAGLALEGLDVQDTGRPVSYLFSSTDPIDTLKSEGLVVASLSTPSVRPRGGGPVGDVGDSSGGATSGGPPINPVPEPASIAMVAGGLGLVALLAARIRARTARA